MSCSEYPSHIPVRTARPSLSPQPRAALQCIPATVRTWLPAPAAKPSPRQDPRPFTDGYGAPGDQAFPGRKMQPGQSSVLGAATASLKISIPIFVIIVCLGGRTPRPPPLLRPPPLAASPKNMPFSALSLAGVRTLCSHVRGLVYVPGFVCMWWLSGSRRDSRQRGSQCVCPLESRKHACGVYLPPWEAGTKRPASAWLATVARSPGSAKMT